MGRWTGRWTGRWGGNHAPFAKALVVVHPQHRRCSSRRGAGELQSDQTRANVRAELNRVFTRHHNVRDVLAELSRVRVRPVRPGPAVASDPRSVD